MSREFKDLINEETPEEMAQREYRLMLDTERIGRMKLMRAMRECIEAGDMDSVAELFPAVETVLALFLRDKVSMKVLMKRALRGKVRTEYALAITRQRLREKLQLLEEYDKDYSALARENEQQRFPDSTISDSNNSKDR